MAGVPIRSVLIGTPGCVRVDRPLDLAAALLGPAVDRPNIDRKVATGHTMTWRLDRPVPVYIVYFTAEPTSESTVVFLPDIYGRDSDTPNRTRSTAPCAG